MSVDQNAGVTVPATGPLSDDERAWMRQCEKGLAERAKVEDEMLRAARGAAPMPDAAKLRLWAQRLGVPAEFRPPALDDRDIRAITTALTNIDQFGSHEVFALSSIHELLKRALPRERGQ